MLSPTDNVILITVDSLRYDRLGFAGNENACSPVLDGLARHGICCARAYAHGFCSQLSYPSIFTSSLPLDHGGYDRGILDRPRSLPEVLREHGFATVAFSSDPMLQQYYGYRRGFDEFYDSHSVGAFWDGLMRDYIAYYRRLRQSGAIGDEEFYEVVGDLLDGVLESIVRDADAEPARAPGRVSPAGGDRAASHALSQEVLAHLEALRRDRRQYIDGPMLSRHLARPGGARGAVSGLVRRVTDAARISLKRRMHGASVFERFGPAVARLGFDVGRLRGRLRLHCYPTAAHQMAQVQQWLSDHRQLRSFAWVCLNDVHEGYVSSGLWSAGAAWRGLLEAPVAAPERAYALYDRSVSYIDRVLGDFVGFLQASGLARSTLVVVCADHGRQVAERDLARGLTTEATYRFAEHLIRVPMLFSHPALVPRVVEEPCGLVDLAPTVLDLLGLPAEPAFRGRSVCSSVVGGPRPVLIENVGGGPCDMRHKEPLVCVVNERMKYVLGARGGEELYDLIAWGSASADGHGVAELRRAARQRLAEVMAEARGS